MPLRDVIEDSRFTHDIDMFRRDYSRIDEVHESLTWLLARNPTVGNRLEFAPDFRLFETTAVGDTPAFWILYSYSEEQVILYSIEPVRKSKDDPDL